MKFGSKFQLGARPRWNLDPNFSWGRSRGGICIQIPARDEAELKCGSKIQLPRSRGGICIQIPAWDEAEVKCKSKFQLGAKPRWNLHPNSSLKRSRGKMWIRNPAGREAEVEFASKFQLLSLIHISEPTRPY